jgi:twinfilin-like protein
MVYSSGAVSTIMYAKNLFPASNALHSRKIETTEPVEIDEAYLVAHLDLASLSVQDPGAGGDGGGTSSGAGTNRFGEEGRGFARPKGPGRRR